MTWFELSLWLQVWEQIMRNRLRQAAHGKGRSASSLLLEEEEGRLETNSEIHLRTSPQVGGGGGEAVLCPRGKDCWEGLQRNGHRNRVACLQGPSDSKVKGFVILLSLPAKTEETV